MSERALIEQISFFYSRKVIMDQIDDRDGRPRQHLAFFIYDYYISMTKTAVEGNVFFLFKKKFLKKSHIVALKRKLCLRCLKKSIVDDYYISMTKMACPSKAICFFLTYSTE